MKNEDLENLKKQQKILFIVAPLTGFMAFMKYSGIFAIGTFPPYIEAGVSVICLIIAIRTTMQIKTIENNISA